MSRAHEARATAPPIPSVLSTDCATLTSRLQPYHKKTNRTGILPSGVHVMWRRENRDRETESMESLYSAGRNGPHDLHVSCRT